MQNGLTLDDLAVAIGTIKQTIYKYEHGIVTNIPDDKVKALAKVLNTTPAYLRGLVDNPSPDFDLRELQSQLDQAQLSSGTRQIFIRRIFEEMGKADCADIEAVFGTSHPFDNIEQRTITVKDVRRIAGELGVTVDYLVGITEDPSTSRAGINNDEIADRIDDADSDLILAVHEICGMFKTHATEDYATGNLERVWNPAKIEVVREYLIDSTSTIQKLIAARIGDSGIAESSDIEGIKE